MADDDRYRWLDEEVAERLLRGSSVNARSVLRGERPGEVRDNVEAASTSTYTTSGGTTPSWAREDGGGQVQHPAQRLASVLDALFAEQTAVPHALGAGRSERTGGQPDEFPGEAEAVEAFRALRAGSPHSGTVDISAGPTPPEATTVVGRRAAALEGRGRTDRRRHGGARRRSLAGRPLRAGFAMAVAGCALGGAAVAAGAGVLPTPFGGGGAPATSVSPLASPSEDREAVQGGANGSPDEPNGPRRGTREGGGSGPSDSPSGEDLAGTERGRDGKYDEKDGGWKHGDGKGWSQSQKRAIARALCGPYEEQELSLGYRLKLEQVAGGAAGVEKFCDKYGGGNNAQSGGVGTPGNSGGNGNSGGGNGSDGGGDGGGNGGDSGSGGDSGGDDPSGGPGGNHNGGGIGTPGGEADGGVGGDSEGTDGQLDGSASGSGDESPAAAADGGSAEATAGA